MPTILKVANTHFTPTGNVRLEYTGNGVLRFIGSGLKMPTGNNANRPSPEPGIIRYNTETAQFEGYNASAWGAIGGAPDLHPSFSQANTARDQANSAYTQANTALSTASAAGAGAAAADDLAESAIIQANTGRDQANIAFTRGNTAFEHGNAAFIQANTGRDHANIAFARANLSFTQSNVATRSAFILGTSNSAVMTPNTVWHSATLTQLTDNTTINIDFSSGFNFGGASDGILLLGGNRTLANPSNVKSGQAGVIWVGASGTTRTLTLSSGWEVAGGVEVGPYSIDLNKVLGVAYVTRSSNVYVTSILRIG